MNRMWSVFTMPYLRRHGRALDQRQQVALHALARHVGARASRARLVILSISSRNTMPFCSALASARVFSSSSFTSCAASSSVISCIASRDLHACAAACGPPPRFENMPWICEVSSSMPGGARISICGCAARHLDVDLLVVELAFAQLLAELLARGAVLSAQCPISRRRRQQHVEDALLGRVLRARAHALAHRLLARLLDADLDQVAHDRVDVAADVADLGELGRLDLDERRVGEPREAARDLGLADAGRPDHQDVLRRDLLAQRLGDLLAAPAVAQRDRHRALRLALADDVLVELVDDFLGVMLGRESCAGSVDDGVRRCQVSRAPSVHAQSSASMVRC